jgi:hypothetical protein
MNRNLSLSAGWVAIVVFVLHLAFPAGENSKSGAAPVSAPSGAPAATGPTGKSDGGAGNQTAKEGPGLASRDFFRSAAEHDKEVAIADMIASVGTEQSQLEFLLATVPDPLHTRLGLATDTSIQAIQRAAALAGWDFATQWLPWNDSVNQDEKDPAKRIEQRAEVRRQEEEPGLMVFRHRVPDSSNPEPGKPRVLFVFLVGETPTAGINPTQFQKARQYMRSLGEGARDVRLMSPTFSGSFSSLAALIAEDKESGARKYRVRSGSATSAEGIKLLRNQPNVSFDSASANTKDQKDFFYDILSSYQIDHSEAAILVEDESGYGSGIETDATREAKEKQVRVMTFPRDIAYLRNAYRDNLLASTTDPRAAPNVNFSLKTESGEDSIPTFSLSQTPLEQNAVISQIASTIREEGIRIVQLNATNVLDQLFLARALRRECPDTRILTINADLLFIQATQEESLRGLLAISTYPLFPHVIRQNDDKLSVVQSDSNGEGVLNATLLLLNSGRLFDYTWRSVAHPPQWLLMLGRDGYSPIRAWADPAESDTFEKGDVRSEIVLPSEPAGGWAFLCAVVSLVSLALGVWIDHLWNHSDWQVDARFDRPGDPKDAWRVFYMLAVLAGCVCLQLLVCLPVIRNADFDWRKVIPIVGLLLSTLCAWSARRLRKWYFWLALALVCISAQFLQHQDRGSLWIAFSIPGILACLSVSWTIIGNPARPGAPFSDVVKSGKLSEYPVFYSSLALVLTAAVGISVWAWCCFFGPDQSPFFSARAIALRFGVSPIWPVLLAAVALGTFAVVQINRLFMAVYQQPEIITESIDNTLQDRLKRSHDNFRDSLRSLAGLWTPVQKTFFKGALGGAVVVLISLHWWRGFRTIDSLAFDMLSLPLQFAAVTVLLLTCWQVVTLWSQLHSFLTALESIPLAHAFLPPSRSGSARPIWVRHLNLQSLDIHLRKRIVLHDLALSSPGGTVRTKEKVWYENYTDLIKGLVNFDATPGRTGRKTRLEILSQQQALRSKSKEIATSMLEGEIANRLRSQPLAAELDAEDTAKPVGFTGDHRSRSDLSQAFVAFHFASFLIYGVRQIQNLMVFLSVGSVLLLLSLNSYPLQSPQLISRVLMVLFVVIGLVMWICLTSMERDAILSRINGTQPGQLNSGFYFKLAGFLAPPLASLLASQFPPISNFLFSWLAPTVQGLK